MTLVRILNDAGVQLFREYLGDLKAGDTVAPPRGLLEDSASSEPYDAPVEIEVRNFDSRMEAAEYFLTKLGGKRGIDYNSSLWSWLTLFYFDQVCPSASDGSRQVKDEARYIPGASSWRYYRHLLAGPYRIYRSHGADARLLLSGPVDQPGDFMEQLASRQELITNRAILGAAAQLYFDSKKQRPKRGAASTKGKAGALRRYIDLVKQLDLTYDLYSMEPGDLVGLLPNEFDSWRQHAN